MEDFRPKGCGPHKDGQLNSYILIKRDGNVVVLAEREKLFAKEISDRVLRNDNVVMVLQVLESDSGIVYGVKMLKGRMPNDNSPKE